MKIKTEYTQPPIPTKTFDWIAYDDNTYDGPGSALGTGETEQQAIADLMSQIAERSA